MRQFFWAQGGLRTWVKVERIFGVFAPTVEAFQAAKGLQVVKLMGTLSDVARHKVRGHTSEV